MKIEANLMNAAELETNRLSSNASPRIQPEEDPFLFEFGGLDEFQLRAENAAIRDRQKARQHHAGHVANWK